MQLICDCAADLRLCFRLYAKGRFSYHVAHTLRQFSGKKIMLFFLYFANVHSGYTFELPLNKYPQSMFLSKNKEK